MLSKITLVEKIKWAEKYLQEKGFETPRLEAEVLVGHVLQKDRAALYRDFFEPLPEEELQAIEEIIYQRAEYIPAAYLTGQQEFMSLPFRVNPEVLIPRPETEILVEKIIAKYRQLPEVTIVDVGTGSGAIAVSLAKYLPQANIYAVDLSPGALKVARENALENRVASRITFIEGNLLDRLPAALEGKVEVIAANLPYIPEGEYEKLQAEVRLKEPKSALIAGVDGFELYRQLIPRAEKFLKPQGHLVMEIGYDQKTIASQELSPEIWEKVEIIRDFQGLDRIIWAQKH